MKEIFIYAGSTLLCALISSILFLVAQFIRGKLNELKQKTDNDSLQFFLEKVDKVIGLCVETTNQVLVNDLKKSGSLSKESAKEAFDMTMANIEQMLSDEDKKKIIESFGDVATFLTTSIENYIKSSKETNI